MKPTMKENFEKLEERVIKSLDSTDLQRINSELSKIKGPTLVSGVGGSSVVAEYASKILATKNDIIARSQQPRDFKHMNVKPYQNVLACSYSGNNIGVDLAFSNKLRHYLLASRPSDKENVTNLTYNVEEKEDSFISLSSTLIPCGILLNYYLRGDKEAVFNSLEPYEFNFDVNCDMFEIFSGIETSTASMFLESTMVESGIGIPIVHDKYGYCHGRSTLSVEHNNIAIYFNGNTELDKLLLNELPKYYKEVVVLDSFDNICMEYLLLVRCVYLAKYIAEQQQKDLSRVNHSPVTKLLYKYKGEV